MEASSLVGKFPNNIQKRGGHPCLDLLRNSPPGGVLPCTVSMYRTCSYNGKLALFSGQCHPPMPCLCTFLTLSLVPYFFPIVPVSFQLYRIVVLPMDLSIVLSSISQDCLSLYCQFVSAPLIWPCLCFGVVSVWPCLCFVSVLYCCPFRTYSQYRNFHSKYFCIYIQCIAFVLFLHICPDILSLSLSCFVLSCPHCTDPFLWSTVNVLCLSLSRCKRPCIDSVYLHVLSVVHFPVHSSACVETAIGLKESWHRPAHPCLQAILQREFWSGRQSKL